MRRARYSGCYPYATKAGQRWKYVLRLPTGAQEVRGGFTTAREAHDAREARRTSLDAPQVMPGTVAELVERYIAGRLRIKPNTRQGYRRHARLYIMPVLGHIQVAKLTPDDVRQWQAGLSKRLGASVVRNARALLSAALAQAVADGRLPRNVVALTETPPMPRTKHTVWTETEIGRFLETIAGDRLEALWLLALLGQLRPGECAGLRWEDIDLDAGTVAVNITRTVGDDGRIALGDTAKTPGSVGTITVPRECVEALIRHRDRQAWQRHTVDLGLVFTAYDGGILAPNTVNYRLAMLCKRAGVTRLTPHDLRGCGATWLINLGVDAATVSQRLRHHSTSFTLDRYITVSQAMQRQAAESLSDAVKRIQSG